MKERLIPKNTLKVLGVAALIAAGGFYEQRHEQKNILPLPSEHLLVQQEEDSFTIIDAHDTYQFSGKFHYADRNREYLAVGATHEDQCAVAIIRPDRPIIEIYDRGINPYRIVSVNDTLVRYYAEEQYTVIVKDFFYHEGITYEVNRYTFPPYNYEGNRNPC